MLTKHHYFSWLWRGPQFLLVFFSLYVLITHSENPKKDSHNEAANHYHGSSLVLREKGRSLPVLSSDRWFTCILRVWGQGEKWEVLWGGRPLQQPFTHRSEVFQYFATNTGTHGCPVEHQAHVEVFSTWFWNGIIHQWMNYIRQACFWTISSKTTFKKKIQTITEVFCVFFCIFFFNMWKSILLKVNLATYVRRFISKWNFQKCIKYPH